MLRCLTWGAGSPPGGGPVEGATLRGPLPRGGRCPRGGRAPEALPRGGPDPTGWGRPVEGATLREPLPRGPGLSLEKAQTKEHQGLRPLDPGGEGRRFLPSRSPSLVTTNLKGCDSTAYHRPAAHTAPGSRRVPPSGRQATGEGTLRAGTAEGLCTLRTEPT